MARRPSSKIDLKGSSKKAKVRVSKTAEYLANLKYLGDEPVWTGQCLGVVDYIKTMTWYNYMCSKSDARKYLETYLKNVGRTADAKRLKSVPDKRIIDQAAWSARILARGAKLDDKSMAALEDRIQKTLAYSGSNEEEQVVEEEKPKVAKPSIQDRMGDKVSDFIGQFEEAIDRDGWTLSMYQWLQKHDMAPMLANRVADFYKPILDEAKQSITDPKVQEGFSNYTKKQLKERLEFYSQIVTDCERYNSNTKKVRVVRKPKTVSAEKKLKHVKHLSESKEYRLVSVHPEKVLGAQELWTFNAKYKLLTVLRAIDRGGLTVSGSTIKNVDESDSFTYRLGKSIEPKLETALNGGKKVLAKMLESLKTASLQTRVNENVLLLKVNK